MDQHSERQILGFLGECGPPGGKLLIHFYGGKLLEDTLF